MNGWTISVHECAGQLRFIEISFMRSLTRNGVVQSQAWVGLEFLSLNM